jgi:hypothetical protein
MVSVQEKLPVRVVNRARSDTRFIGDLMGCYIFSDQRREDAAVKVFACRARSISSRMAVFDAPVSGEVGTPIAMRFDPLGLLHGEIDHEIPGGFVVRFVCTDDEREALAGRIDWLKHYVAHQVPERRQHKRVLPRHPHANIVLAGGHTMPCLIIDMSRSGVAVSADIAPPATTLLAVGSVPGRVVRYLDCGFAIEFSALQDLDKLEALLTLKTGREKRLATKVLGLSGVGGPIQQ